MHTPSSGAPASADASNRNRSTNPSSRTPSKDGPPQADPQAHPGMGAIVHDAGIAFRVWAPNADAVSVVGSFNDWDPKAHAMQHEENGYWYANIESAKVGDEYRYLIRNGEKELSRIDPYAREVTNSVGNGVICDTQFEWGDDNFQMPPLNELVLYELHIGTFNEDPEQVPGDFHSVIERLDHLKDLGVNAIEIMPTTEFAGDLSWGYNPAHIFAVESAYGGPRGLKQLVKKAHEKGIAVILDVVYNHFGPSDLDLWQFDGWSENDLGGIYFYNDWRSETPWGATRPDYGRGEVRQFIRDNAFMWLEEYHMDGLRYDMTLFIRSVEGHQQLPEGWSLTQWINSEIRERYPQKILIAEDLQDNDWLTKPTPEGGAGFHAQWDAKFVHPVRGAVIQGEDRYRSMATLRESICFRYNDDFTQRVIYSESHDEVANGKQRVPSEVSPSDPDNVYAQKRSVLAGVLVFTAPGVPMLFQGQEFLEDGWFQDEVPLDWDRAEEFKGIVQVYQDLIRLRLNRDGQTRGLLAGGVNVHHVDDQNKVLAFHRWDQGGPGDDVVVVLNFSNQLLESYRIGFPSEGTWRLRLNTDWKGYSEQFGNRPSGDVEAEPQPVAHYPASASVTLAAYSALIYSRDRT